MTSPQLVERGPGGIVEGRCPFRVQPKSSSEATLSAYWEPGGKSEVYVRGRALRTRSNAAAPDGGTPTVFFGANFVLSSVKSSSALAGGGSASRAEVVPASSAGSASSDPMIPARSLIAFPAKTAPPGKSGAVGSPLGRTRTVAARDAPSQRCAKVIKARRR